jgi:uracil-DNA glycosylase family 4
MLSRDDVLTELGIGPVWRLREGPGAPLAADEAPLAAHPSALANWDQLADAVAHCTACKLHASRTQGVLGVGDRDADWLIVGEAPGADEDAQGEPFVGQAGKLLDAMLAAIGLKRGDNVYITNVLKSRPPGNRNPEPDEVAACRPYLLAQIELIRPKIILALGRFAAQSLLETDETIGRLRGRVHQFRNVPLVVTYHPAYLLRNLTDKARAWEDLCLARRTMQALVESIPNPD